MGDTTDHLLEAAGLAYHRGEVSVAGVEELHIAAIRDLGLSREAQGEITPLLDELKTLLTGISLIRELCLGVCCALRLK
ncbi:MAG: hypothetical protein LBG07_02440 [Treponema sp.]|nr:hypothetical protein [Treponema sp.]